MSSQEYPLPPELLNDDPDGFAWSVWHDRTPKLIQQIKDANVYGPTQLRNLDLLLEQIQVGAMTALDTRAGDREVWEEWGAEYFGRPWTEAPFLWSESYFYRCLLQAVGFFDPGPWRGVDPFAPLKEAELRDPKLQSELEALGDLESRSPEERGQVKLLSALWGNRADLGFKIGSAFHAVADNADQLVSDDSADIWKNLSSEASVILVADNAGRELMADLLLIDHLLEESLAASVSLHLKPYPYYVSDATGRDLVDCMRRLNEAGGTASVIYRRLCEAVADGSLSIDVHDFYCAPWSYHRMPASLRSAVGQASLVLLKGDLNYRRLIGDRHWLPTTSFHEVTRYFPTPVAALRTLKSDAVVGIEPRLLESLEASSEFWRTNGRFGLIQASTR